MSELKEAIADFEISEAYGLAIKVEEDGFALYQKALKMTDNSRAKEDLEFLRDQEMGHKVFFEKLLKETGKEYKTESGSALYLWVTENLFRPIKQALENNSIRSYKDVLSIGIEIEEKSILLYKELKKAAEDKENKKAIAEIIKEEQRHKTFLVNILRYSDL